VKAIIRSILPGMGPFVSGLDATALARALPDGLCVVDVAGRIVEVNERLCALTGFSAAELVGAAAPHPFWPGEEAEQVRTALAAAGSSPGSRHDIVLCRRDGERLAAAVSGAPLAAGGAVWIIRDTTPEVRDREFLEEAHRAARLVSWEFDPSDGRVDSSGPGATVGDVELPPRPTLDELVALVAPPHDDRLSQALSAIADGLRDYATIEAPLRGRRRRWIEVRARAVRDADGTVVGMRGTTQDVSARKSAALFDDPDGRPAGIVAVSVDISESVETERRLRAASAYQRAITDNMGEGLFTIDVDGRLIDANAAAEELLGWRQDELAGEVVHDVIHFRRPDGSPLPAHECPLVATRTHGELVRVEDGLFIRKDGSELPVKITSAPFETEDGVSGSVIVFSDISAHKAQEERLRQQMEAVSCLGRVREALAEDGFVLHAQPIVDLATGETINHELLIRMREPGGSFVAAARFLPAAEEFGLIADIDRWVLARAAELAAEGHSVQLNLSARSIATPGLADEFRHELRTSGADPGLIVLELTETALLEDIEAAESFIQRIRALGCKLALDDFGTGYGGFTYLKRLPFDYLKIDAEFVCDLRDNLASRQVVTAVVSLARGFGQRTIAEGVEDERTLELLRELGVDHAQGYAIAAPAPAPDVFGPSVDG